MTNMWQKVRSRLEMMLVKAMIEGVDDSQPLQLVKISALADETQDGMERLQNYGLSSVPTVGSEAFAAYLNGNRDHGVVVVCDSGEHRPTQLKRGEVTVYSQHGQSILLKEDGTVEINGATDITLNGDTDNAVSFSALKTGFDALKIEHNAHIHNYVKLGVTVPTSIPVVPAKASIDACKVATVKVPA